MHTLSIFGTFLNGISLIFSVKKVMNVPFVDDIAKDFTILLKLALFLFFVRNYQLFTLVITEIYFSVCFIQP